MIELIVTSFPFILRVAYLRWRRMPVTLFNVHWAVFLWLVLALMVFFAAFYYHPKSYTGIAAFRTVPIVAETGGTVTAIHVENGDRVEPGQLLFTIDDTTERATVDTATRQVAEIDAAVALGAAHAGYERASRFAQDHGVDLGS